MFPRVLAVVACALALLLAPSSARADDPCPSEPPIAPHTSVVHVEAREHRAIGVVVGAPDLVVTAYEAIEVDVIGGPDARVIDAEGASSARVVAVDRHKRLALLQTVRPVGVPLAIDAGATGVAATCVFAVGGPGLHAPAGHEWTWHRHQVVVPGSEAASVTRRPEAGSPALDVAGRVVGVADGAGAVVPAAEVAALVYAPTRSAVVGTSGRRSVVFYGSIAPGYFELAPGGGGWWGGRGGVSARYRDLLEARVDLALTFLLGRDAPGNECGEPPCFQGARVTTTPSVGLHLRIASIERTESLWITPSLGVALVLQEVYGGARTRPSDVASPSAYAALAPGIAVGFALGEVGFRARLPRGAVTTPTYEIGVGFVF